MTFMALKGSRARPLPSLMLGRMLAFSVWRLASTFLRRPSTRTSRIRPRPRLSRQAKTGGFTAYPEAVSQFSGKAKLQFPGDTVFTQCVEDGTGEIQVTSIRDAVHRLLENGNVDLLKLDCEGGEWSILADRTALRRINFVTMEYHLNGKQEVHDLIALLEEGGLEIHFRRQDGVNNGRIRAARKW